ncbi:MAG: cation:proton antiporter [Gemmatimonadetes bacterium]|nr:cation:proton antiporter [Gemmatimonadota bacterium]
MTGIALLLGAALLGHAVALALRLPAVPFLLLSGVLLARTGLVGTTLLEDALVLGVAILLFVTGVELNPIRTRTQRDTALRVGVVQFFTLAVLGFAAALALGFDGVSALYIGLALTASSTLVVTRLLQRRGRAFEPFARMVLGVLLLQDVLVILAIPLITRLAEGPAAVGTGLLGIAIMLALTVGAARWIPPRLARLEHDEERVLLIIMALLFGFIVLSSRFDLPFVVGAFLAGVAVSRFPASGVVRGQLGSIGDFFAAVFFPALGALLTVLTPVDLTRAVVLALLVLLATPPIVAWLAERAGFSARPALEAGLLLAQTSELSLVVGLFAMLEGYIAPSVFTVIGLVTALTMIATPFVTGDRAVLRLLRIHPTLRAKLELQPLSNHIVLLGAGATGMPLIETLLSSGYPLLVVDDDPAVIARLREADVACIRGDASDESVLKGVHAADARVISSTIRRPRDNRRLLEIARGVPVLCRVFEEEDARWVREMGGIPVVYSEAAAEGLLSWLDRMNDVLEQRLRERLR